jgi:hypothetical protein
VDHPAKLCQSQRNLRSEKSETRANKKSRGFLLCFSPACTLPQVLCQIQPYWSGVSVPAQAVSAAALYRTTASATEQKERTPVVLAVIGDATA